MGALAYGLRFVACHFLRGKTPPLIRGLVLSNRCNLRCQHCRVPGRGPMDLSYLEVTEAIDSFYQEGGRCLYLEGGEPFLWHDGRHRLNDVVDYARGRGYLTVVVYTNGTMPLETSADVVFVSVDGLQPTHDALRGESFDRIMQNIRTSPHRSLYINFTINQKNKNEIAAFCEFVRSMDAVNGAGRIRGIFFYFHTPYYGRDALYLEIEERRQILRELLELRKRYRILNSRAGLLSALRNDWRRPLGACSVYEQGVVYPCCRFSRDDQLCRDCGYLSYAEIDQTLKLKPTAIFNALKYF